MPVAEPVAAVGAASSTPRAGSRLLEPRTEVDESERMELFGRIGVALTVVAAVVHLVAVVSRGLAADPVRVPWGNMYEFTLTGTLVVVVGYLLLYQRSRCPGSRRSSPASCWSR